MPTTNGTPTQLTDDRWVFATIREEASGGLLTELVGPDGATIELRPTVDLNQARSELMRRLRELAAAAEDNTQPVVITEPDGRFTLAVPAHGTPADLADAPAEPSQPTLRPVPTPTVAFVDEPLAELPPNPVPVETAAPTRPSFDDLLGQRPDPANAPADEGVRGAMRQLTGGRWKMAPGVKEREKRNKISRVQKPLMAPRTIVIANPKGGAHKTPMTLKLAQKFGHLRGEPVLAWDNNENRGTLGWRAAPGTHNRTVAELLARIRDPQQEPVTGFTELRHYVRSQGPAHFDVLATPDIDGGFHRPLMPAEDFDDLHAILRRFYPIQVVDTGNNMASPNWGAAIRAADQLVIVSTIREDTAQSAGYLADALLRAGHEQLLANAIMVFSHAADGPTDKDMYRRFRRFFEQHTRAVLELPYDPALASGKPIGWHELSDQMNDAILTVAAEVADGL